MKKNPYKNNIFKMFFLNTQKCNDFNKIKFLIIENNKEKLSSLLKL